MNMGPTQCSELVFRKTLIELFSYYGFEMIVKGYPAKRINVMHALSLFDEKTGNSRFKKRVINSVGKRIGKFTLFYPPVDLKWYIFRKRSTGDKRAMESQHSDNDNLIGAGLDSTPMHTHFENEEHLVVDSDGALANIDLTDDKPLVVDLDGTLIKTDLLYEGFILLLRKNLLYIFPCLFWLLRGKAYLKCRILKIVHITPELLPYNKRVLNFLQKEFDNGRKLILATASPLSTALEISRHHPIFDEVYGTEENINLKGKQKLKLLMAHFGEFEFDYIGNSRSDLVIFASSRYSYLVNPTRSLERSAGKISNLKYTFRSRKTSLKDYIKAIRVHQWVKNFLIFVPLITSHSFYSADLLMQAIAGFFAFSFVASGGYLVNDLSDLNSDRSHPTKRFRPLASGQISILTGSILAFILFAGGLFLASKLNTLFLCIVVFYFLASLSYSLYFKRFALYDVFILALLYSTRVIAGGMVTNIPLSFWLISFSTFLFLSLAFVKRYSELMKVTVQKDLKHRGREYYIEDISLLQTMAIVSGFLSIVVFSLYIDSSDVTRLYSKPKILWAISLLLLFWISRIWLITNRGKMNEDPIIFAIKDTTSYFIFLFIGIIILVAI